VPATIVLGVISPNRLAEAQAENFSAVQTGGLFIQTCVRFSGDKDGLRQFLADKHMPVMNSAGSGYFLDDGRSGVVYDASNRSGRLAVVSHDDGSCTATSESADGDTAVGAVESFLRDSHIAFKLTGDHPNAHATAVRERSFDASFGPRRWQLVLGTSSAPRRMHAIFTASPPSRSN
jgi:hypothetical protein